MMRPSISVTGVCAPKVPVTNASSARIGIDERVIALEYRNALDPANLDHLLARNAVEAVVARRRPHLAPSDDEEVGRVRGIHEAVRVKHQRFVRPRLDGVDPRKDAVQLGMRVEFRILGHRQSAHDGHRVERQAGLQNTRGRRAELGDDDDGGALPAQAGILKGLAFGAPRYHQPGMHVLVHVIRPHRVVQGPRQGVGGQSDVEVDGLGGAV